MLTEFDQFDKHDLPLACRCEGYREGQSQQVAKRGRGRSSLVVAIVEHDSIRSSQIQTQTTSTSREYCEDTKE